MIFLTYTIPGTMAPLPWVFRRLDLPLGLRFEGSYNKFLGRSDIGTHADVRIIAGTANLVYALPGVGIRPYLIGGGGYYSRKADLANAQTINAFGVNGGVGLFPLSSFNAYVEARGHIVFSDGPRFVPVTFGVCSNRPAPSVREGRQMILAPFTISMPTVNG